MFQKRSLGHMFQNPSIVLLELPQAVGTEALRRDFHSATTVALFIDGKRFGGRERILPLALHVDTGIAATEPLVVHHTAGMQARRPETSSVPRHLPHELPSKPKSSLKRF